MPDYDCDCIEILRSRNLFWGAGGSSRNIARHDKVATCYMLNLYIYRKAAIVIYVHKSKTFSDFTSDGPAQPAHIDSMANSLLRTIPRNTIPSA